MIRTSSSRPRSTNCRSSTGGQGVKSKRAAAPPRLHVDILRRRASRRRYLEIQNLPFGGRFDLESWQETYNEALLQPQPPFDEAKLLLVNGGSEPTIALERNKWYRGQG